MPGQAQVSHLAGKITRTRIKASVEDEPGTHSRTKGKKYYVIIAFSCAIFPLSHGTRVRVVLDKSFDSQALFGHFDNRHVVPSRQVRR